MKLSSASLVRTAWLSLLSTLLLTALACTAQEEPAPLPIAVPVAGSAGVSGSTGVGGMSGAPTTPTGGAAGDAGAPTQPFVEPPSQLPAAYPLAHAVRTCFSSVGDVVEPIPVVDAGAGDGDAGSNAAGGESPLPGVVAFDAGVIEEARPVAPVQLSQSGCFASTVTHQVSADLVPYAIRAPLFTDGAHKERYFVIPENTTIATLADGTWQWPVGSVLLKTFSFDFPGNAGPERRPVETRIMKRSSSGKWHYWSYQWNQQGTDATLLEDGMNVSLVIADRPEPISYGFPSELSCRACHGFRREGVLGPSAMQLDLAVTISGSVRRQLDLIAELGVVEQMQPATSGLVDPSNETAPIEARARSYLHGNCSHCHQPGGYAPPDLGMDLRFSTALKDAELCGASASFPSAQASVRIAPGNPEQSDLWLRFTSDGLSRMPMIGTSLHDPLGEKVLKEWIESLASCP